MNACNLFISLVVCMAMTACSAMEITNDFKKESRKTLSTLLKLIYKANPMKAKTQKAFYERDLNNFNLHSIEVLEAIKNEKDNFDNKGTAQGIEYFRNKIITESLIPLKSKIKNILLCIKENNLYCNQTCNLCYDQNLNTIDYSPRIQIIDSIINAFQDKTIPLDHKKVKDYQSIMNYIIHFSIRTQDTMVNDTILTALESITLGNHNTAQELAILLDNERLNAQALEKCKEDLKNNLDAEELY